MKYVVRFSTNIHLDVTLEADTEDAAADTAWDYAQSYLETVHGDGRDVTANASLDGVGASVIQPVS